MKPIFEGQYLRLLLVERDLDHLFVSFDHWHRRSPGQSEMDCTDLFVERRWSYLQVQTARNDWFLNPDLPAALRAAADCAARFGRITTCGISMGGYGALRCAEALGAARAVAISPQATPDPARTPFETRWPLAREAADVTQDDFSGLNPRKTECVGVYDPLIAADAAQMRVLRERVAGLVALPLAFGGHPATRVINDDGKLSEFTALLLTAPFERAALLNMHKQARRHSRSYDWALNNALAARLRPA